MAMPNTTPTSFPGSCLGPSFFSCSRTVAWDRGKTGSLGSWAFRRPQLGNNLANSLGGLDHFRFT
jgi:hypothetical protein